jgi:hypothetical protein
MRVSAVTTGPADRQLAYRVTNDLAERVERVAAGLGLDTANFLRMMTLEQIGVYERCAARIRAGEDDAGD